MLDLIKYLKSSMDRFIDAVLGYAVFDFVHLKSSMDRFIGIPQHIDFHKNCI